MQETVKLKPMKVITREKLIKFIKGRLNHKSTRIADRPKLEDCLLTLMEGNNLDTTQTNFIMLLHKEYQQRNKQYRMNRINYEKAQLAAVRNSSDVRQFNNEPKEVREFLTIGVK